MPRKRKKEHQGLPSRWIFQHGKYYFCVPKGQEDKWDGKKLFPLGKALHEAYKEWAARMERQEKGETISDLLDKYLLEVVPTKAKGTQRHNREVIPKIRAVFGHMKITDLKPKHIYQYADKRSSFSRAKEEIKVLKHAFTKAVQWGFIENNHLHGQVRLETPVKKKKRLVENWEVDAVMSLEPHSPISDVAMIQAYIELKELTGLRKTDMLLLRESDLLEEGIFVEHSKTINSTGVATIYEWTPRLRKAIDRIKLARPIDIAEFLFCTRRGKCYVKMEDYTTHSFDSAWQRTMKKALETTDLEKAFSERSLRNKVGTAAGDPKRAQELLRHASEETTKKFYRLKPEIVKPLK